ncbi:MAG: DUF6644 family protein [Acidobacteriota bacterium]
MLLPLFEWFQTTFIATAIHGSVWLFPVIQCGHLLGLVMLGGALVLMDLRLLGLGLTTQPVGVVSRATFPWLMGGLALMTVTGIPMFLSEAVKCYYNFSFWVKITTFGPAILFAVTVRRRVGDAEEGRYGRVTQAAVAVVSLGLWLTVAAAGRWIGFSG